LFSRPVLGSRIFEPHEGLGLGLIEKKSIGLGLVKANAKRAQKDQAILLLHVHALLILIDSVTCVFLLGSLQRLAGEFGVGCKLIRVCELRCASCSLMLMRIVHSVGALPAVDSAKYCHCHVSRTYQQCRPVKK